jgi:hypothetical protein
LKQIEEATINDLSESILLCTGEKQQLAFAFAGAFYLIGLIFVSFQYLMR